MVELVSFLSSLHMMPNVRWPMRFSIVLLLIFLTTIAQSHTIHKRHNIFESEASIDKASLSVSNETVAVISSENEPPAILDDNDGDGIEDVIEESQSRTKDGDTQNVNEVNNVNNNELVKVSSTTDINNGIDQSFGARSNNTIARDANGTVAILKATSNAPSNFTKDFSHDESVENRLPSKSSDRTASRSLAKVTTISLKEATRSETAATAPEKPKRLDAAFARSTERGTVAVADSDASTMPVSHSTVSLLSTHPVTPRIAATETIRARISSISSDVAEKRAKYLIESNTGSSSASPPSSSHKHTPDIQWSNLKTVGEVQHNNVTHGKVVFPLSEEHTIGTVVNGKLDIEENAEKDSSAERSSIATTIRNAATAAAADEEHETQLQKSNSSRIADVQEDNSLSSLTSSSSSHRPTDVFVTTTKTGQLRPIVKNQAILQNIPKITVNDAYRPDVTGGRVENSSRRQSVTPLLLPMSSSSSTTEHSKSQENPLKTTEDGVHSTTTEAADLTTMGAMTNDETTTPTFIDEMTTLSQHDSTLSKTPAMTTNEDLIVTDDASVSTTTIIPTTDVQFVPTTIPDDENKIEPEPKTQSSVPKQTIKITQSIETSTATSAVTSTTLAMNSPPTKEHTLKPIDDKQRIVIDPKDDDQTTMASTTRISTTDITAKILTPTAPSPTVTEQSPETMKTMSTTIASNIGRKVPESHFPTPAPADHTEIAQLPDGQTTDVNAMIAVGISIVAVITLILLVGFLYVMRKRQKQLTYSQRCRPIGLDAYSLDNISIYNSVRRKSAHRSSKRAFGNAGFDDPGLKNNPLTIPQLATFAHKRVTINEEFRDIPTVTARIEEVPIGCEDKNRYANVVPLPESRVHLKQLDGDEKTEYINANFVKGPKDTTHYYIACQAPLEHTIIDFWRMIWEQNSRVIIMATDLTENGIEKCAEYLPSSFVIDNHVSFGDYQITLKMREVRDKYAVSMVHLRNSYTKTWREITHFWYQWPENGVPNDEASVIAMLLEARSYLKMATVEQSIANGADGGTTQESGLDGTISNGNLEKNKSLQRVQGPLTVHCSPGTGRTGTIIACDIAIRSLELPMRSVDIPQIVYFVRRGRASAVQTREQYDFVYKLAHVYATKLTGSSCDN